MKLLKKVSDKRLLVQPSIKPSGMKSEMGLNVTFYTVEKFIIQQRATLAVL